MQTTRVGVMNDLHPARLTAVKKIEITLAIIVYFMVSNGWRAITWGFLTEAPRDSMTKGGILPCIVGTLGLSIGALIVAFPIGVASAIYLNEYARPGRVLRLIRLGINNLAGVPSVVFGLFGLAFFVIYLKMGVSLLAGALTLGAMTLPMDLDIFFPLPSTTNPWVSTVLYGALPLNPTAVNNEL